ncbi:MAG: hypothetical protein PVI57_22325 [Gemmatimonadota bacterium]|jgi:hypothetical protein
MSHVALQGHIRDLNDLKSAIQQCRQHIRLLRGTQANYDARDLLRLVGELEVERHQMQMALDGIRAQARSAKRQVGRTGPGMTPGGNLGVEVQGLLGHVSRSMNDLLVDLRAFNHEQLQRMKDPTRTPSGAPDDALELLWTFIDAVFDISGKIRGRKTPRRKPR